MRETTFTEADRGSLGMAVTLILLTVLVLMIFFIIANPTIILDQVESTAL
jgi:hypothetical protein